MRTRKAEPQGLAFREDDDLPEGWTAATIGDITVRKVAQSGPSKGQEFLYVDIASVDNERKRITAPRAVPTGEAPSRARQVVRSGDVLVSMTRPNLNSVALVGPELDGSIASTGFDVLRSIESLPGWLFLVVRGEAFVEAMTNSVQGALYPAIRPRDVRGFEFPLPPLPEQRRIVEKVEALLARVNAARARLARAPALLKAFRQAVLSAACSGRLTGSWRGAEIEDGEIPESWNRIPLEDLLSERGLFDGPFGSSLKSDDYTNSGVRVIRLENIGHLKFVGEKECFVSQEKYSTLTKHTVGEGDIIFGSFVEDDVRVCMLPRFTTKAIAKADCFCIRPKANFVSKRYLTLQLAGRESYDSLVSEIHGATRPRVNTKQLRSLEINVAPLLEQREIVRRVEALFALADAIEAKVAAAQKRADALTQAILAKAFRGELVPTEAALARTEGRPYETAAQLLDRVVTREENAGAAKSSLPSKGRRSRHLGQSGGDR